MKSFLFFIFFLHVGCVEDKIGFKNAKFAGLIREIDSTYDNLSESMNAVIGVEKKLIISRVNEEKEGEFSIATILCKLNKQKGRFTREGSGQYPDILFQMKELLRNLYANDNLSESLDLIMGSLGPSIAFNKNPREALREQLRNFSKALLKLESGIK